MRRACRHRQCRSCLGWYPLRTLGSWSSHLRQGPHFRHRHWLGSSRWKPPIRQGDRHHRCLHCSCWCLGIAPLRWSNHRRPSRRRRLRGRGGRIHRPKLPKQPKGRGTKPLARSSFSFSCFFTSFCFGLFLHREPAVLSFQR